ncbi:MAG: hypothetical protein Q8M56_09955 [Desulfobacterales bacterium]|nr:hypothetical protein [Desulfobacterales bacterium]
MGTYIIIGLMIAIGYSLVSELKSIRHALNDIVAELKKDHEQRD